MVGGFVDEFAHMNEMAGQQEIQEIQEIMEIKEIKEVRDLMKNSNLKIEFDQQNPHSESSLIYSKYEKFKGAKSVNEAKNLGASIWDLGGYFEKGNLQVEGVVKIQKEEEKAKRNLSKDLDKENHAEAKSKSKDKIGNSNEQSKLLINLDADGLDGLIDEKLKSRKDQFKSKVSKKPDIAAEHAAETKLRREANLDIIRKLELVK